MRFQFYQQTAWSQWGNEEEIEGKGLRKCEGCTWIFRSSY